MARNYDVFLGSLTTPLSIPARVERFDTASGAFTVTNGVAFRPGDVTTQLLTDRKLRVFVSGVEQAIYTEALAGRHPDNTVKSVLIQFQTSIGLSPLTAEIRLGEVRATTDIVKQTLNNAPNVLLFPTNPIFLCAANPTWRSLTPMSNRPTGSFWDDWEKHSRSQSPFANEGWKPIYDYALLHPEGPAAPAPPTSLDGSTDWLIFPTFNPALRPHYEFFAMTGEGFFLWRGLQWGWRFLRDWANHNNWGITEEETCGCIDATMHYWLTGNTTSRDAPLTAYNNDPRMFNISAANMADRTYIYNHGRMHHNKLMMIVIAHHLGLPPVPSPLTGTWEPSAATNAAKARLLVDSAISQQFADGHNTWPDQFGHQQNWEVFQRATAIIAYHKWVSADSDILSHIQAGYNYINNSWWFTTPMRAWGLEDASGTTVDGRLNGFGLEVSAWLYRQTGTASYKTRGDEAMAGVGSDADWGAQGQNPKVPGQCQWGTMSYIAARQGVP